ncbi:MAG: hypothetical protein JF616_10905 [Fibrobacteres bacterium]|nr:hypothetical protein [Fibrobacterota bacterium]
MRNAVLPMAIVLLAFGAHAAPAQNAIANRADSTKSAPADTGAKAAPAKAAPAAAASAVAQDSAAAHKALADSAATRAKFAKDSLVSARKIDEIKRLAQKDSLAAVRKKALDSASARSRYVHDSLVVHHKHVRDSIATRQKFVRDSLAVRRKLVMDSLAARLKYVHDSLAVAKAHRDSAATASKKAHDDSVHTAALAKVASSKTLADSLQAAKAAKDSVASLAKAAAKAKADSIASAVKLQALAKVAADKALAQSRADSVKNARAAKAHNDSLSAAAKRAHADSLRAAAKARTDSVHAAARARADSVLAAGRHRADSLKAAAEAKVALRRAALQARTDSIAAAKASRDSAAAAARAAQHEKDSTLAKSYRILNRPVNKDEVKYFLTRFKMKDAGKPESTAVNWVWRDKSGALLTYEPGMSELGFSDESVPMLDKKDYVPDSLIRFRTDGILRELLQEKADRYAFANYEITMVQKKSPETKDQVLPAVPAYYFGRYIRKLDDRLVLGDAFQVRLSYGAGGATQLFSLRDPVLAEGAPVKVPTRQYVADSLVRWTNSRTRPRTLLYPYHPDRLRIRDIKPVKILESYVETTEKFRDAPQLDGTYLMPSVTVLAQVYLYPSATKSKEPPPVEPILLHFHFPCRPGAGLCWPDAGQGMEGGAAAPAGRMAPPRNPGATAPNPAKAGAPGEASAPAKAAPSAAPTKRAP